MSEARTRPPNRTSSSHRSLIMAASPSFDIVSKVDRQEVDNALPPGGEGARHPVRLPGHRHARSPSRARTRVTITSETEERAAAALDVFKEKLVKRNISLKSLDAGEPRQSGKTYKIDCKVVEGIDAGQGQGDQQEDPRRGPEGRPGADPGRPAAGDRQEAGRPAGRDRAAQAGGLRRRAAVHELPVAAHPPIADWGHGPRHRDAGGRRRRSVCCWRCSACGC